MNIVIANRQQARKIDPRLLKKIAEALLADLEVGEAELGINLVAAREMTLINETFLRHEGPTDVITFDYSAGQALRLFQSSSKINGDRRDACPTLHGEIFICVNEAVSQSKQFKTTWQSEIVRYFIHGVLHLLGHDDHLAAARRKMKREESRLLAGLSRKFCLAQIAGASKLRV
jgi:probable rRNA maturation factor